MEWAIGLRSDYSSATLRRLARRCGSGSSAFGAGGHFRWHACRPGKAGANERSSARDGATIHA
jgi:hypothetical protein